MQVPAVTVSAMLGKTYERENCSAARTLEQVGERWSLLIIRDALFRGRRRFVDFQRSLGLATNVLAARLDAFVAAGIMERHPYSSHEYHYEYLPTDKGRDLAPIVIALTAWGDCWAAPWGPPIIYRHNGCGGQVSPAMVCDRCRDAVAVEAIEAQPGPGAEVTQRPADGSERRTSRAPQASTGSDRARASHR